jgi:hypothetical protein
MSYFQETAGAHELTSVKNLPNCQVVHPGERWTDAKASGVIVPGQPIVMIASGSAPNATAVMRLAKNGDAAETIFLATRTIDIPDPNQGPLSKGPNEVRNQNIPAGEWIMRHRSGVFLITLVTPGASYKPGDLIGWDLNGVLPSGKEGEGAWALDANADIKSVLRIRDWKEVNSTTHEGYATVEFVGRTQGGV